MTEAVGETTITVTIKRDFVDPDPVHLHQKDQALWESDEHFTVRFSVSPFINGNVFESKNGTALSGPLLDTTATDGYPYNIEFDDGQILQARVIIDP